MIVGRQGRTIVDWGAIGAIAELIGGAGVIASLVYLAIQIRQNTRTERTRAFQDIFSSYNAHNHEMFSGRNGELIVLGMRNLSALSGAERLRFDHFMIGYLNSLEATIFSKGAFLLEDETLENWAYILRTRFLPYAGFRDWSDEAKPIFVPETRVWIDAQISRTDLSSDFLGIK
jgi:hypothetical protein